MHSAQPELIDIGANLSHESFAHDLEAVIKDAQNAGINNILLTGTSVDASQQALELTRRFPGYLYSTAGVHPHEAAAYDTAAESTLRELAVDDNVKAIGETGLDFNRDYSPRQQQEQAFAAQLALASAMQLPVFLHQRDAHERFHPILKEYRDSISHGVVHCFTGTREELHAYLDLDMYIGITGWICDERRGHDLHPLIKDIPRRRLLLETDAPYLLPRSIRPRPKSRRNVPANLIYVLQTVAACLQQEAAVVAAQTTANARDFFAI